MTTSAGREEDLLRARLGVEARINDSIVAGIGVATSSAPGNPRGANVPAAVDVLSEQRILSRSAARRTRFSQVPQVAVPALDRRRPIGSLLVGPSISQLASSRAPTRCLQWAACIEARGCLISKHCR